MEKPSMLDLCALLGEVGATFAKLDSDTCKRARRTAREAAALRKHYAAEGLTVQRTLERLHAQVRRVDADPLAEDAAPLLLMAPLEPLLLRVGGKLGSEIMHLEGEVAADRGRLRAAQAEADRCTAALQATARAQEAELARLAQATETARVITGVKWDKDDGSGTVAGFASFPGGPEVMDFVIAPGDGRSEAAAAQEIWDASEYANIGLPPAH